MGNDGGSIAKRDEVVRTKAAEGKPDVELLRKTLWTLCALSRKPLRLPIVSDALGRLYNKDAVIEYLLERQQRAKGGTEDAVAAHIRGLKDTKELKLTRNPDYKPPSPSSRSSEPTGVPFLCPLSARQMDGKHRFVYVAMCGCVMSEAGLRTVVSADSRPKNASPDDAAEAACPLCGEMFRANGLLKGKQLEAGGPVVVLNPSKLEEDEMRAAMEQSRTAEAAKKKAKKRSHAHMDPDPAASEDKSRSKAQKAAAGTMTAPLTA